MKAQSKKPRKNAQANATPKAMQPRVLETIFTGPSLSRKSRVRLEQEFRKLFANVQRLERQLINAVTRKKDGRAAVLAELIAKSREKLKAIAARLEQPTIDVEKETRLRVGTGGTGVTSKPSKYKGKTRRKASKPRSVDPALFTPGLSENGRPTLQGATYNVRKN